MPKASLKFEDLYDSHPGETIYILGTGPSIRLFPEKFFKDKITIGLNQVWKTIPCFYLKYLLTIHPHTIPIHKIETKIITKRKSNLKGGEPYYFFKNNKDVKDFSYCFTNDDTLYVGRGIHTAAMTLAAKMGARWCVLVGCDMAPIANQHHATNQEVQFHGLDPQKVYHEYYFNARQLRSILKKEYDIDFLSVWPFISTNFKEEFNFLLKENNLPLFSEPQDNSTYMRDRLDFTS